MNVLMLTSEFSPNWGGIGTYVTELTRHMDAGVHYHILMPKRIRFGHTPGENDPACGVDTKRTLPKNVSVHYLGAAPRKTA